ncbi:hypothetical protein N9L68_06055 [bacterium]|nr:hypothetical protein [bacterium]
MSWSWPTVRGGGPLVSPLMRLQVAQHRWKKHRSCFFIPSSIGRCAVPIAAERVEDIEPIYARCDVSVCFAFLCFVFYAPVRKLHNAR